ncbi:MAG: uroporphyrinogen-III synthase [Candidatus Sulfotelmatobacter sp.]
MLVGRARHQAGTLSAELRRLGAQVIEIPFIEIRKPKSLKPLDEALKNLATYDWLILTSVNGVEAMWDRLARVQLKNRALHHVHISAIGPATKKAIEERGLTVDVVPKEYVAESVVESLKKRVKGKSVLLVRAKVARDVIPRELRKAGARVDVVEAYETVVPESSRRRLSAALTNPRQRPHVVTFTSSSTVRNFVQLLGGSRPQEAKSRGPVARAHAASLRWRGRSRHISLDGILLASIGPVTSSTLRDLDLPVGVEAAEFTIPGLVAAILHVLADKLTGKKET